MGGLFLSPGQVALEGRLANLVAERAVLADAVANIDTPGFQPAVAAGFATALRDAARVELGLPAGGGAPAPAAGGAAGGTVLLGAATSAAPPAVPAAVTPDGNGVDLNATMVALAETDLEYQAVARQLQLGFQNLQSAIDTGGA